MAQAVRRFLDSDGDRQAISDLDELHEAIDRVEAYQDFQPDRFDRRTLNRQLRLLAQDREVRR
jgi:chromosomal replication initiation ATPase DnaA